MDLTKLLRNSGTARDCEISFVILSAVGLLCIVILYLACLFEGNVPKGLFLAAIAYFIPGAIISCFGASLYFSHWLFLSRDGGPNTDISR
jgi:hypothetical protein